jgi:hypothetical protein
MVYNHCCFFNRGVFGNVNYHGNKYRIEKGDKVMLEMDTNKRTLHLFINNIIQLLCIINVQLHYCFLIVFAGKEKYKIILQKLLIQLHFKKTFYLIIIRFFSNIFNFLQNKVCLSLRWYFSSYLLKRFLWL